MCREEDDSANIMVFEDMTLYLSEEEEEEDDEDEDLNDEGT